MAKPVELGVAFGAGPSGAPPPAALLAAAEQAEAQGFASLWLGEHILWRTPVFEALTAVALLAGRTRRIKVGTGVLLLPLRHPTLVAKQAATLDYLTEGRLLLGIGVGGEYPPEFAACGVDVRERGPRTDEALPLLRRLWAGESVSHQGRFYQLDGVGIAPLPAQPGGPPLWIGGRSPAAYRRVARFGDGWIAYLLSPERMAEGWAQVRVAAEAIDRDPASLSLGIHLFSYIGPTRAAAEAAAVPALSRYYNQPFEKLAPKYCLIDSAPAIVDRIGAYLAAGADHVVCRLVGPPEQTAEQLDLLAREVMPQVG